MVTSKALIAIAIWSLLPLISRELSARCEDRPALRSSPTTLLTSLAKALPSASETNVQMFRPQKSCNAYDRKIIMKAEKEMFRVIIPCMREHNAELADALVVNIKTQKNKILCNQYDEGSQDHTGAFTRKEKDSPIYLVNHTPSILNPGSGNVRMFSEDVGVYQLAFTLAHEALHNLGLSHNMIDGKYSDAVYGFQILCTPSNSYIHPKLRKKVDEESSQKKFRAFKLRPNVSSPARSFRWKSRNTIHW